MEKLKNFLTELGFGKNEIEVYLALVTMRESSVLQISKNAGIHRANIYDALDSLLKRGLVFSVENPVRRYYARHPSSLLDFIKRKEIEFKEILEEFEKKNTIPEESRVGRTKGKMAVRESIFSLLEQEGEILAYGLHKELHELLGFPEENFHRERKKKNMRMKLIYNTGSKRVMLDKNKDETIKVRNLPKKFDTGVTTFICGKKIVMIHDHKQDNEVIEIEDKEIAQAYADYFTIIWNRAKCDEC